MDEILRALQRRYRERNDPEAAHVYITQLERSQGLIPDDHRPLDQILMNMILGHFDDDGVNSFHVNATQDLVSLILGKDALKIYRKYLDGAEWRNWISYPQLDRMLVEMKFTCGHLATCEHSATCEDETACGAVGCQCPGCLQLVISQVNRNFCFHHSELIIVHSLETMEQEGLRLRQSVQKGFDW